MKIRHLVILSCLALALCVQSSCRNVRIKSHPEWKQYFDAHQGIRNACFEMYDNNKEIASYFNKSRCSERIIPGGVFDIFNSLVALSTNIALNETFKLTVKDTLSGSLDTLTLTQAFRQGNSTYFKKLALLIPEQKMQYYLDTVQFGNQEMGDTADGFFSFNGSLLVTPDEMVGFMKRLYHGELPAFDQRSMRLVQDMMLQETEGDTKLYYRYATVQQQDSTIHWLVGYAEHVEHLKNPKTQKVEPIPHPYFFAMNFVTGSQQPNQEAESVSVLKEILADSHIND